MITHKITPYKPSFPVVSQQQTQQPVAIRMGKFEYAKYLSNLTIRKGDYIVHYSLVNKDKISPHSVFIVDDIMEMHGIVDYEYDSVAEKQIPKCLHLKGAINSPGGSPVQFWTSPARWDLCPQNILKELGFDNTQDNSVSTSIN